MTSTLYQGIWTNTSEPLLDLVDGQEEYEVNYIVTSHCHQHAKCPIQYKVCWKGYAAKDDTWEPAIQLYPNAKEAIEEFHQKYPDLPGPLPPKTLQRLLKARTKT